MSESQPSDRIKARVTQSDIARVAGVHNTTVSLALRNSPAIPEATRRRIQTIAEEMGYFPDPALRALIAYRNGRRPHNRQQTIAYLTNWTTKSGWQDLPAQARVYNGVTRKAEQLGYQIEHFWLGEPGMSHARVSNVLFHRGIRGALVAAHRPGGEELVDFDWSRLSAVKIGCFPQTPALHRVVDDQIGVVRMAMRRMIAAGAQRIGLVLPSWWDELDDQAWSSGFLMEQRRLSVGQRVPILRYQPEVEVGVATQNLRLQPVGQRLLAGWIERHRPDAILALGSSVCQQLGQLGFSVPNDVAFVDLSLEVDDRRWAGVRPNSERAGEIAVEMLISLMQQNLCGVPDVPTTTLVEGAWVEGESLPALRLQSAC